jgi:hypothetical protein
VGNSVVCGAAAPRCLCMQRLATSVTPGVNQDVTVGGRDAPAKKKNPLQHTLHLFIKGCRLPGHKQ